MSVVLNNACGILAILEIEADEPQPSHQHAAGFKIVKGPN